MDNDDDFKNDLYTLIEEVLRDACENLEKIENKFVQQIKKSLLDMIDKLKIMTGGNKILINLIVDGKNFLSITHNRGQETIISYSLLYFSETDDSRPKEISVEKKIKIKEIGLEEAKQIRKLMDMIVEKNIDPVIMSDSF